MPSAIQGNRLKLCNASEITEKKILFCWSTKLQGRQRCGTLVTDKSLSEFDSVSRIVVYLVMDEPLVTFWATHLK